MQRKSILPPLTIVAGVATLLVPFLAGATDSLVTRADPVPIGNDGAPPRGVSQGVIFVNFDGETLLVGNDNSHTNTTGIPNLGGPFAAYGEGQKREAVMQAVRQDWAAYNVRITDTRPEQGDYVMNMTGPTNPFGGGVLGIAPLDCNDASTHNNITFAFHSVNDSHSAAVTATTIGQEVAHSFGLEHVADPSDIMNPSNAGGDASFHDECISITGSLGCPTQHEANCGTPTQQNAHQELLALFGPAVADKDAPVVELTAPSDGAMFDVGASFEIEAMVTDASDVIRVTLYREDAELGEATSPPYSWPASNAETGMYLLHAEAEDVHGNVGVSSEITVYVGVEPDDGGEEGGEEGGSGDDEDDEDQPPDEDESQDEGDEGSSLPPAVDGPPPGLCACRGGRRAPGVWLLLLVACASRRRRPRCGGDGPGSH